MSLRFRSKHRPFKIGIDAVTRCHPREEGSSPGDVENVAYIGSIIEIDSGNFVKADNEVVSRAIQNADKVSCKRSRFAVIAKSTHGNNVHVNVVRMASIPTDCMDIDCVATFDALLANGQEISFKAAEWEIMEQTECKIHLDG